MVAIFADVHCNGGAGFASLAAIQETRDEPRMIRYFIRRLLYAFPILIGVNLITFFLFFVVNTPDNMARIHLGVKHVTPDAIGQWKVEHGYD